MTWSAAGSVDAVASIGATNAPVVSTSDLPALSKKGVESLSGDVRIDTLRRARALGAWQTFVADGQADGNVCLVMTNASDGQAGSVCSPASTVSEDSPMWAVLSPMQRNGAPFVAGVVPDSTDAVMVNGQVAPLQNNVFATSGRQVGRLVAIGTRNTARAVRQNVYDTGPPLNLSTVQPQTSAAAAGLNRSAARTAAAMGQCRRFAAYSWVRYWGPGTLGPLSAPASGCYAYSNAYLSKMESPENTVKSVYFVNRAYGIVPQGTYRASGYQVQYQNPYMYRTQGYAALSAAGCYNPYSNRALRGVSCSWRGWMNNLLLP